jgi:hypothetical protein
MANTTFKGPVRSENGFLEWNGSAWVPVQGGGGGGGGTTFVDITNENSYTNDAYADPPTGPTAGNIIQLPVIGVGETYTIFTGASETSSLAAWALQFPAIPGADITAYYANYNVKSVGGDGGVLTVLTEYSTRPNGVTDTFYIYGFIETPMQIMRIKDFVVPGFGTVAAFQQIVPPSMPITPYPDPFVYPFTNIAP